MVYSWDVSYCCGIARRLMQAFSSGTLCKVVEVDSIGLDPRHLQNRQDGVDHLRRAARIAVHLAGKLLVPKMPADGFVDETGLTLPLVGGLRVRQRRNEFEVGRVVGDGCH